MLPKLDEIYNFKTLTRLESKVSSLERLYPSSPVEVSKSQTNSGSKEKYWVRKKILGPNNNESEKFWVHKSFGSKNFWVERYCPEEIFQKNLALKNVSKKFWVQKKFGYKEHWS